MLIYFAPMEGITVYPYRMTHAALYGGIDRYFLPFVETHQTLKMKTKEKKDLAPEHNPGGKSVPQLLGNRPGPALAYLHMLSEMGYSEFNFNLGCPSGTVTAKKKGAGFLDNPDAMDEFFEQVFEGLEREGLCPEEPVSVHEHGAGVTEKDVPGGGNHAVSHPIHISVKTRIGMHSDALIDRLIKVYNRYPFSEIIVHPRLGKDLYKGPVRMDAFDRFYHELKRPVSYNGDITAALDARRIIEIYPGLHAIMIGRGLLKDPALAEKIARELPAAGESAELSNASGHGAEPSTVSCRAAEGNGQPAKGPQSPVSYGEVPPLKDPRLPHFLDRLQEAWMEDLGDRTATLCRMKELWSYLGQDYEGDRRLVKKIMKCKTLESYQDIRRTIGV